jgi:hypothetical protein
MVHGGYNEKPDEDGEQSQPKKVQELRTFRQLAKTLLEDGVELKAEQDLRADNQHAGLIQRDFDVPDETHDRTFSSETRRSVTASTTSTQPAHRRSLAEKPPVSTPIAGSPRAAAACAS